MTATIPLEKNFRPSGSLNLLCGQCRTHCEKLFHFFYAEEQSVFIGKGMRFMAVCFAADRRKPVFLLLCGLTCSILVSGILLLNLTSKLCCLKNCNTNGIVEFFCPSFWSNPASYDTPTYHTCQKIKVKSVSNSFLAFTFFYRFFWILNPFRNKFFARLRTHSFPWQDQFWLIIFAKFMVSAELFFH